MRNTAKRIKIIGILGSIVVVLSFGVNSSIADQDDPEYREIGRVGHYIAYAGGMVRDTKTGLEWIAGPDKNTDWNEADRWVDCLLVADEEWRIPTIDELKTLYEKGRGSRNMIPLLKTTGWYVWSAEIKDSSAAWGFCFYYGIRRRFSCSASGSSRAFAVRSIK